MAVTSGRIFDYYLVLHIVMIVIGFDWPNG